MNLEDKPFMKHVTPIILKEDTVCTGCSTYLKKGQKAIDYDDKKIGGIYCGSGCLEGFIDCWYEGGRDEAIMESHFLRLKEGFKRIGS